MLTGLLTIISLEIQSMFSIFVFWFFLSEWSRRHEFASTHAKFSLTNDRNKRKISDSQPPLMLITWLKPLKNFLCKEGREFKTSKLIVIPWDLQAFPWEQLRPSVYRGAHTSRYFRYTTKPINTSTRRTQACSGPIKGFSCCCCSLTMHFLCQCQFSP